MISVRISEDFLEGVKTFQRVPEDSGVVSRGCTRDSGVVAERVSQGGFQNSLGALQGISRRFQGFVLRVRV